MAMKPSLLCFLPPLSGQFLQLHIQRPAQGPQSGPLIQQGLLGLLDGDLFKSHLVSGLQLAQAAEVGGDHVGDLGVAAGGLPVGPHDDGLARGGHLHGPEGDAVGDDVAVGDVLDGGPVQAAAHAVKLVGDGVGLSQEGWRCPGG